LGIISNISQPIEVATAISDGIDAKSITSEKFVNELIAGQKKDKVKIRVGDAQAIYFMSRFMPKIGWNLINKNGNSKRL